MSVNSTRTRNFTLTFLLGLMLLAFVPNRLLAQFPAGTAYSGTMSPDSCILQLGWLTAPDTADLADLTVIFDGTPYTYGGGDGQHGGFPAFFYKSGCPPPGPYNSVCINGILTFQFNMVSTCGTYANCNRVDLSATWPASMTIAADAMCNYDADTTITGVPTNIIGGCPPINVSYWEGTTTGSGSCLSAVVITRNWSIEDANGDSLTYAQTITVWDSIAPTFTFCPSDTVVACEDINAYTHTANQAAAEDNCTPANQIVMNIAEFDDSTYNPICANDFRLIRSWEAVDLCGNKDTCYQLVTVTDTEAPTLTGTLPGGAQGNVCMANAPAAPDTMTIGALFTDNCNAILTTQLDSVMTGTDCSWTLTYNYEVTDGCNADTVQVVYTGGDTEAPTFTVPGDTLILRDAMCLYDADTTFTGYPTDEADNCATGINATYTDSPTVPGSCPGALSFTRTWSMTDG